MDDTVSQKYYVYSLAYPDGTVFYIGKGKVATSPSEVDRIDGHELEALRNAPAKNARKQAIIKEIWASGGEVIKNKLAFFEDELDAYIYEWGLINMTCYSEQLVNVLRGPMWPVEERRKTLSMLDVPICLKRGIKGKVRHQITDITSFCAKYGVSIDRMRDMLSNKLRSYDGWCIVRDCVHE